MIYPMKLIIEIVREFHFEVHKLVHLRTLNLVDYLQDPLLLKLNTECDVKSIDFVGFIWCIFFSLWVDLQLNRAPLKPNVLSVV